MRYFTWKLEFASNILWIIGFFIGWASFQYRLKNSATYNPLYSSSINIKMQTNAQKRQHFFWRQLDCNFLIKRVNAHYDQMELLEIHNWKMEILLVTAKTDFCSLIFQMLASYIGPKGTKDFCDILTWRITRKLIINSFSKSASLIKVIGL